MSTLAIVLSYHVSHILFRDVALNRQATPSNSLILTPDIALFLSLQPITTAFPQGSVKVADL